MALTITGSGNPARSAEELRILIETTAARLTGNGSPADRAVIARLRNAVVDSPLALRQVYAMAGRYRVRCAAIWYSRGFCRLFPSAVALAAAAVEDRSRFARYRAYELLACSLDERALPLLASAATRAPTPEDASHAHAAINAIRRRNHHLFLDRSESGKSFLRCDFFSRESPERRFGSDWEAIAREQNRMLTDLYPVPASRLVN